MWIKRTEKKKIIIFLDRYQTPGYIFKFWNKISRNKKLKITLVEYMRTIICFSYTILKFPGNFLYHLNRNAQFKYYKVIKVNLIKM